MIIAANPLYRESAWTVLITPDKAEAESKLHALNRNPPEEWEEDEGMREGGYLYQPIYTLVSDGEGLEGEG